MNRLFHYFVITILIILGLCCFFFFGKIFSLYIPFFLFLWFSLPIIAIWLKSKHSKRVRSALSIGGIKFLNAILLAIAFILSLSFLISYEQIRDTVGKKYVEGYYVTDYETTGDSGETIEATAPHTAHWYSRFGLWLLEWLYLGLCIGIPLITMSNTEEALQQTSYEQDTRPS